MMQISSSDVSCGIAQLHELTSEYRHAQWRSVVNNLKEALTVFATDWLELEEGDDVPLDGLRGMTFIFSDVVDSVGALDLVKFIKDNKLGSVRAAFPPKGRRNPNTGNMIQLWHWCYNGKTF